MFVGEVDECLVTCDCDSALHSYDDFLFLFPLFVILRFFWCLSLIHLLACLSDKGCLGEWVTFVMPDAHSPSLAYLLGLPEK